jgi:nucleoside-diphosphate-sugar epimerase
MPNSYWTDRKVLVTGGSSFIGSHLVDKLITNGADVRVVDNLSSGKLENLSQSMDHIEFINRDLEYVSKHELKNIFKDIEAVFHLAAVHGGRGFISIHPADVMSNLSIDHHVLEECANSKVENVVFASTACVYPTKLQEEIGSQYKLKESDSNPFSLEGNLSADIEYGWGKLMGEIQLISFHKQYGLKGCPVRFVTAYGPRENETHAIIALIYKAMERMDPFEIWGDGHQERDFTYVEDIVSGCMLAGEKVSDCTPINLGTGKKYEILDVASKIFELVGWKPSGLRFNRDKPVGALSRALDNSRAREVLSWEPKYSLNDGLRLTIDWYKKTHKKTGTVSGKLLLEHESEV